MKFPFIEDKSFVLLALSCKSFSLFLLSELIELFKLLLLVLFLDLFVFLNFLSFDDNFLFDSKLLPLFNIVLFDFKNIDSSFFLFVLLL